MHFLALEKKMCLVWFSSLPPRELIFNIIIKIKPSKRGTGPHISL